MTVQRILAVGATAGLVLAALIATGFATITTASAEADLGSTAVTSGEQVSAAGEPAQVPELSTQTSTTVRTGDRSNTLTDYSEPVNGTEDDGARRPIDNRFVEPPGSDYGVQNAANSFTVKIPMTRRRHR